MARKVITVSLPGEIWEKLQERAEGNSKLPSETARELIRDSLSEVPAAAPAEVDGNPRAEVKHHSGHFDIVILDGKNICRGCGEEIPNNKVQDHYRQYWIRGTQIVARVVEVPEQDEVIQATVVED